MTNYQSLLDLNSEKRFVLYVLDATGFLKILMLAK